MVLNCYTQYLSWLMKLINNYIVDSRVENTIQEDFWQRTDDSGIHTNTIERQLRREINSATISIAGNNTSGQWNALILKKSNTDNYMLIILLRYTMKMKRTTPQELVQKTHNRKTLEPKKIYLEICSTYNHLIEVKYATKIHQPKSALYGECKAGVAVIKKKGKLGDLYTRISPEVTSNTLSIPKIYKAGYHVTY